MKPAQIIIEYAIMSAVAIALVVLVVTVIHLGNFSVGSTFGFKSGGATVTVPPMTP